MARRRFAGKLTRMVVGFGGGGISTRRWCKALFNRACLDHRVHKAEQSRPFHEGGATYNLDLPDGLHQHLSQGAAGAEQDFEIDAAPGFGAGLLGAFAEGLEIRCRIASTRRIELAVRDVGSAELIRFWYE